MIWDSLGLDQQLWKGKFKGLTDRLLEEHD